MVTDACGYDQRYMWLWPSLHDYHERLLVSQSQLKLSAVEPAKHESPIIRIITIIIKHRRRPTTMGRQQRRPWTLCSASPGGWDVALKTPFLARPGLTPGGPANRN